MRGKNISLVCNQRNGTYNPNKYMKTCGHISLDMAGSNFSPEYIYLRGMDSNVNKTKLSCKT